MNVYFLAMLLIKTLMYSDNKYGGETYKLVFEPQDTLYRRHTHGIFTYDKNAELREEQGYLNEKTIAKTSILWFRNYFDEKGDTLKAIKKTDPDSDFGSRVEYQKHYYKDGEVVEVEEIYTEAHNKEVGLVKHSVIANPEKDGTIVTYQYNNEKIEKDAILSHEIHYNHYIEPVKEVMYPTSRVKNYLNLQILIIDHHPDGAQSIIAHYKENDAPHSGSQTPRDQRCSQWRPAGRIHIYFDGELYYRINLSGYIAQYATPDYRFKTYLTAFKRDSSIDHVERQTTKTNTIIPSRSRNFTKASSTVICTTETVR